MKPILRFGRATKRRAVSELVGTLLMVAITLVAGAAAFSWVNGQTNSSESIYGANAAAGANYLQEHFAPITQTFTGPAGAACSGTPDICTIANFWIFNNGRVPFTLSSLQIQSAAGSSNPLNIVFTSTAFTAYNAGGTAISCSPSTPGFSYSGTNPVPVGTLSGSAFSITIPTSCGGVNAIYVGQGYIITMTGLYGNVVQFQVTANG
jgi:flagellin-like protein